jgi:hypothetical protein
VESHSFVTVALHQKLAEGNKEICKTNFGFGLKIYIVTHELKVTKLISGILKRMLKVYA